METADPTGADTAIPARGHGGATLDEWRSAGSTFPIGGQTLFCRTGGEGPPLLLIHGFPTASWDWSRIWPALARRFRLVAMDMLGFGFSSKPRHHHYSIFEQADLQQALLARLGISRVHILAHDYGDTVAQELLARHAERRQWDVAPSGDGGRLEVASLCFLNGGLFPEASRPRPIQKWLASPVGPIVSLAVSRRRFAAEFAALFGPRTRPGAEDIADFWRLVEHGGGARLGHRLIRYLREREEHRERWVGVLGRAAVPLRLIYGPEDPVSGAGIAARYRELVPEADVVALPGIGHYPQVEDPAGVLRAFFAFHDESVRERLW
jgi:pimeloyl-ACP methyl ester carboxylesterase